MASSIWGGVPGAPEYGPGRPRTMYNIKQTIVEVFACLGSSHGFLSTIFGILRKFWIDIGKNIFRKYFFSRPKKILEQNEKNQFLFLTKNENFEKSKFQNFENLPKFRNFQNFDFSKFSFFVRKKKLKIFSFFSKKYFWSWKKYIFEKYFYLYQFKISPGFQKSYLENRARSLNMRKLQL